MQGRNLDSFFIKGEMLKNGFVTIFGQRKKIQ